MRSTAEPEDGWLGVMLLPASFEQVCTSLSCSERIGLLLGCTCSVFWGAGKSKAWGHYVTRVARLSPLGLVTHVAWLAETKFRVQYGQLGSLKELMISSQVCIAGELLLVGDPDSSFWSANGVCTGDAKNYTVSAFIGRMA